MKHTDEPIHVNGTNHANPSAGWKWWDFPMDCIWSIVNFAFFTLCKALNAVLDQKQNFTRGSVFRRERLSPLACNVR